MGVAVERVATWECLLCPNGDVAVLRDGPHYSTADGAEAGLRHHVLTEHPLQLWDGHGRVTFGHVLLFEQV